jgi:predicted nucleic acid-binding protein
MKTDRIFLDTNILLNDFLHRYPQFARLGNSTDILHSREAHQALTYIRRNRLFKTYVASFSIARFVSFLDSLRVPKNIAVQEINMLLAKNTILTLTQTLVREATDLFDSDTRLRDFEDAFQFIVCQDHKCYYFLTLNSKDFRFFPSIMVVTPSKYRIISL